MIVTYKPGEKHNNADFFSRLREQKTGLYVVNLIDQIWQPLSETEIVSLFEEGHLAGPTEQVEEEPDPTFENLAEHTF